MNERTRVVLVTDSEVERGGAEQSLRNLLEHLSDDFEPIVAGMSDEILQWVTAGRPGTETLILPRVRSKWDIVRIVRTMRVLAGYRPAIVHANLTWARSCRFVLLAALLVPGLEVVAVEQLPTPSADAWQRRWRRTISRRLSEHVAVGRTSAAFLEDDLRLPQNSVVVIQNGVPDAADAPAPPRPFAGVIVGSHARYTQQKGFDTLLRAMAPLDVAVVLVGDGPEHDALASLAAELGMTDRVLLTGWESDPRRWLQLFDVFVLPSRHEGFPLSLVEAMLASRPIVACDVGSVAEAIQPGVNGVLVPPDDPDTLREAVATLLSDPALSVRLAAAAREDALARHTSEVMAESFASLYRRVCRRAESGS